ncbi:MAG: transcription elongation factor GreA [Bacteroidota bacterium]|nr:transcription elongation factor GreA [Bacteroidota bacterium]
MGDISYFSQEGLDQLKKELDFLMNVERPKISRQIGEARDKGDLSENAEYDAAKEAQGLLELKISRLRTQFSNARLIDESKIDSSKAYIYATVTIKNLKTGAVMEYTLVNQNESDLRAKKISVESPIAKGLLGKKVGDEIEIEVPVGKLPFEIIDIQYK